MAVVFDPERLPSSPLHAALIMFHEWAEEVHPAAVANTLYTTARDSWQPQLEQDGSLRDEISHIRSERPYVGWDAPERREMVVRYVAARKLEGFYLKAVRASGPLC